MLRVAILRMALILVVGRCTSWYGKCILGDLVGRTRQLDGSRRLFRTLEIRPEQMRETMMPDSIDSLRSRRRRDRGKQHQGPSDLSQALLFAIFFFLAAALAVVMNNAIREAVDYIHDTMWP